MRILLFESSVSGVNHRRNFSREPLTSIIKKGDHHEATNT